MRLIIVSLFLIIGVCLIIWHPFPLREGIEDQYSLFTITNDVIKEDLTGVDIFTLEDGIWKGLADHYGDLNVTSVPGGGGEVEYKKEVAKVDYYKRLDKFLTLDEPAIEFDRKTTNATSFTIKHKGSQIGRLDGDQLSILQHPSAIALMPFIVGAIIYFRSLSP